MALSEKVFLLGNGLFEKREYAVALKAFERALESSLSEADCSEESKARINMGIALSLTHLSRLDDALKFARKGQELWPTFSKVYYVLATVHYKRNEFCDAFETANLGLRFINLDCYDENHVMSLLLIRRNSQHQLDKGMFEPSSSPSSTSSSPPLASDTAAISPLRTPSTTSTLSTSPTQCLPLNTEPPSDVSSSTIVSKKTLRNKKKALRKKATKDKRVLAADLNQESEQSAIDDVDENEDNSNTANDASRADPSQDDGAQENETEEEEKNVTAIGEGEDANKISPDEVPDEVTKASRSDSAQEQGVDTTESVEYIEDCVELAFIRNEKNWLKFVEYTEVFGPVAAHAWAMENPPVARVLDRLTNCLSLRGLRVDWKRAYISSPVESRRRDDMSVVKIEPHIPVAGIRRVYKSWDDESDEDS